MPVEFKPHSYQTDIKEFIFRTPRCAVFAAMGTGKSVTTLSALDALSMVDDVYPVLIVAPLRVAKSTWPDEVAKWAFTKDLRIVPIVGNAKERLASINTPADIYTTNYESLPWIVEHYGDKWPFVTVVADECFVAGTRVSAPSGDVEIQNLKVGDIVDTHIGPRPVTHIFKRFTKTSNLVCLTLNTGVKIYATKTHQFFTDAGWLSAEACGHRRLYDSDSLRELSDAFSEKTSKGALPSVARKNSVLQQEVSHKTLVCDQPEPARNFSGQHDETLARHGNLLELWKTMVRGDSEENVRGQKGSSVSSKAGWQRDGYVRLRGDGERNDSGRIRMEPHCLVEGEWGRLSVALQDRLRKSSNKDLSGSGRLFAQQLPDYESGQEKDREIIVVGVESCEDKERSGEVAVFNIEVEGAPTYFANGVLVHNCTRLKSFRTRQGSKRAKALAKVAHTKVKRFIGLTGTPSPNGLSDLWGQMWFVDRGERLGSSFSAFEGRWFTKGYDGYSIKPLPHAQREIEERLKDVCITVKGLPVDEPIPNVIYVDLPSAARKVYDEMEKEMFAEIEEIGVEALNAAAKTIKCQQIAAGALITDETGKWTQIHDEKLEALHSVVEEAAGAPVLVAYKFKADLARLKSAFPKGRELDADPATIKQWNEGRIPLLFAHPASAGHGLNLAQGGNILTFFNVDWSLEGHMQIIERVGPMRQKQAGLDRPVFIHYILARKTVDEMILERLRTKKTVQETLLEAMRRRKTK